MISNYFEFLNKINRKALLVAFLIGFQIQSYSQQYAIPENVKRILFLGNSITYGGQFTEYVETYLTLKYPEKRYEFINVGLPSETVSGLSEHNHANGKFPRPDLHERLERILNKTKPDLVFACYGMNDGIYLPFDEERFLLFKEGINWMYEELTKTGVSVVMMTPPIYDDRKGEAYANVLDIYSDWLISKRYTDKWNVIDIHWPMKKYLEDQMHLDTNFLLANDGVHPNETGHFLMSKSILLYLGEIELSGIYDFKTAIAPFKNGDEILKLIKKRQVFMKDAWLTNIGHLRPSMTIGISMSEAENKSEEIEKEIQLLLK